MANTVLANMSIVLGANIKGFERNMAVARKNLQGFAQAGERLKNVGAQMSMYLTAPLTLVGGLAVKAAGDLEALEKGFAATYKEAGDLNEELRKTREVAKLPGLGLKEAIQGATNLQAVGFAAEESRGILMAYGNALATVGKGKAELDGVVTALSQMSAKGKVSAEEINQIAERVPQIRKVMQEAFGTADTEVLQKMDISVEQFVSRTTAELQKLPQVTGGINNAFENMSDAGFLALTKLGNAIDRNFGLQELFSRIADAITNMAEKFDNLSPTVQRTILLVGGLVAAAGPLAIAIGTVSAALPFLSVGFAGIATAATAAWAAITGPVGLVLAGLAAVAVAVKLISDRFPDVTKQAQQATDALRKQQQTIQSLETNIRPLVARYEELKNKSKLSQEEQAELESIVRKIAAAVPGAATEVDKYGRAISVSTEKVRAFVAENKLMEQNLREGAIAAKTKELQQYEKQLKAIEDRAAKGTQIVINQKTGSATIQNLSQSEFAKLGEQADELKAKIAAIRGERRSLFMEGQKGLLPAVDTAQVEAAAAKTLGIIEGLQERLKALQEKKPTLTAEADIASINQQIKAVQEQIKYYEELGIGQSKQAEILRQLQSEFDNANNRALVFGTFQEEAATKVKSLESAIGSLLENGISPQSSLIQGLKAQFDSLNTISLEGLKNTFDDAARGIADNVLAIGTQVQQIPSIVVPVIDELSAKFNSFVEQSVPMIHGALVDAFAGIGAAIGEAATGASISLGNMASMILMPLADMAVQVGKVAIGVGIGIEGIKKALLSLNPAAALAAGAALIALGSIAKSALSKAASGGGSVAPRASGGGFSSPTPNQNIGTGRKQNTLYTKISGRDLVFIMEQESGFVNRAGGRRDR